MDNLEQVSCQVIKLRYNDKVSGYTAMVCESLDETENHFVAAGYLPGVELSTKYRLYGKWEDSKYGYQFKFDLFEEILPDTREGILAYLSSGKIKGIGKIYAKRLVDKFGSDTIRVIEEEPKRLLEVPGVGKTRVDKICKSVAENKSIQTAMMELSKYGITANQIVKIFNTYQNECVKVVKNNPYRLCDDIWGFGFKTADDIASKIGFDKEHPYRLRSAVLYKLNEYAKSVGHCFLTDRFLLSECVELLQVSFEKISMVLDEMLRAHDVFAEPLQDGAHAVYLPSYYAAENGVAKRLSDIFVTSPETDISSDFARKKALEDVNIKYDDIQLDAILKSAAHKVLILTGGPGTGKTTTTKGILKLFASLGLDVLLAAPTGRAAKRLSEATGGDAKTIHRLLEYKNVNDKWVFTRNPKNPLEGDVLIVDECSMVDLLLMHHLLRAVPDKMRVILVGDIDQLPSVGAGNVLRDLINCRCFPVVCLTHVFRQAQKSMIIRNAHKVNKGMLPELKCDPVSDSLHDFTFIDVEKLMEEEHVKEYTPEMLTRRAALEVIYQVRNGTFHQGHSYDAKKDVQVLAPMKKGFAGTMELNIALQESLNGFGTAVQVGKHVFRLNDKVMQIRNNYNKEVFNGNIGYVSKIVKEDKIVEVNFDNHIVQYDFSELDELVLAYAATVHKSQGSEYPVVIMPLLTSHYIMLQRNLLYTAITRAKEHLVIIGTIKALATAIRNNKVTHRNSFLLQRCQYMDTLVKNRFFS